MIETLITLLVICIIIGLIFWILQQLPVAQPWRSIILAIAAIIAVIYLLQHFL